MTSKKSVEKHAEILRELAADAPFTVFLCGPTLDIKSPSSAAQLRKRIIEDLEGNDFEVVLGEDDGLEEARLKFGLNAQDNELEFTKQCNAIIIVASSPGSFCELGLFSWHYVRENGVIGKSNKPSFIVLIDKKYEAAKSYLNEGPVNSILGLGQVMYVDYATYETDLITKMMKSRRSIETLDRRGRPKESK